MRSLESVFMYTSMILDKRLTVCFSALAGTAPFPKIVPRLRLGSVIALLCLISAFVSSYTFMKSSGFLVGIVFFGDPVIMRSIKFLNLHVPHWQKFLQPQKYNTKAAQIVSLLLIWLTISIVRF